MEQKANRPPFSSEINWMIGKAKIELVDGYECGTFHGKLPAPMARKVIAYAEKHKYASTLLHNGVTLFLGDGNENNSYGITVYDNGAIYLYFERESAAR